MCAIIGALIWDAQGALNGINSYINEVFELSIERGRDGRGWDMRGVSYTGHEINAKRASVERATSWGRRVEFFPDITDYGVLIGNLRAEPTTEYVEHKAGSDQQPYTVGPWTIVHNGTIANDKELRTHYLATRIDSAAIAELLYMRDMEGRDELDVAMHFESCVAQLKGSYAILATHAEHPGMILAACNYRPIWTVRHGNGMFFASSGQYLNTRSRESAHMLPPYSSFAFFRGGRTIQLSGRGRPCNKALVVCSGGLDSVVAATMMQASGVDIELVHFCYGSRAEGPEVEAVHSVAMNLDVPLSIMPVPIYRPGDSPLLRADSTIAGGEEGAEFAHEWVPARNLVMLSIATAMAEAGGFDTIVLGNNLEEAGAYPDNEPEFINRFNDLLPFAVGDGKQVTVRMPVGNMMKHEIVAEGLALQAPLHLTWSCYRAGKLHCGTCGPCYMRKKAFAINGAPEVIKYACEEQQ